jgi:hypothetical protein
VLVAPEPEPEPPGLAGTNRFWHDFAAAWNFAFVSMFPGKIGPFPEKFGAGSL